MDLKQCSGCECLEPIEWCDALDKSIYDVKVCPLTDPVYMADERQGE